MSLSQNILIPGQWSGCVRKSLPVRWVGEMCKEIRSRWLEWDQEYLSGKAHWHNVGNIRLFEGVSCCYLRSGGWSCRRSTWGPWFGFTSVHTVVWGRPDKLKSWRIRKCQTMRICWNLASASASCLSSRLPASVAEAFRAAASPSSPVPAPDSLRNHVMFRISKVYGASQDILKFDLFCEMFRNCQG